MTSARQAGANTRGTGNCEACDAEFPQNSNYSRKFCSDECRRGTIPTLEDRLWGRVAIGEPDECWEWQGYRMPSGHGQIAKGNGQPVTTTHRVAWESANGRPVPEGLLVRHTCDNPPCCNPAHLLVGTDADNRRDAMERGRLPKSETHPSTVLSENDVRAIRRRYRRFVVKGQRGYRSNSGELAQEFGVSRKYVAAIAAGGERSYVSD